MAQWERRRILIWGKTRPELSKTYREIVCTGGVFEDTRRLVRLYPIPLRYMDDEKYFRKYQWIDANVMRNTADDARPESYKIRSDGIEPLDSIDSQRGSWDVRSQYILATGNTYRSVEDLLEREAQDKTSLGIVKPAKIVKVFSEPVGASELARFHQDYDDALKQMDLPMDETTGREIKPLTPSDYRFGYVFECADERCKSHKMRVLDWEIDALYFNMKQKHGAGSPAVVRVEEKLKSYATADYELRFFLGNIHNHPKNFTIVGLWYPRRQDQGKIPFSPTE